MKITEFCKKLENAEARFEFVIAVFCDIRSFSSFSKTVESPDTSTFLKHFYLKLLRDYFQDAVFAKPTGDGLLIIFRHNEKNLNQVSELVFSKCFKAIEDFPKMFKSIPIINYEPPDAIGFGIARGSASYLIVGKEILDYSGKTLNLAARLNELARPTGIVIDGNYQDTIIPESIRKNFKEQTVYLRGIAEHEPTKVFYSEEVIIPAEAMHPLIEHKWMLSEQELTVADALQSTGVFSVPIPEPLSRGKIKAEYRWRGKVQGTISWQQCKSFSVIVDSLGYKVCFPIDEAKAIIKDAKLEPESKFVFRVHYVPKPTPQEKKGRLRKSKAT
jgi:class 3 adenylate cyclase